MKRHPDPYTKLGRAHETLLRGLLSYLVCPAERDKNIFIIYVLNLEISVMED